MITIANNADCRKVPHEFFGLSTDEKPIDKINGIEIANGSVFIEIDTKEVFMFDEEHKTWI